jgi:xanthine dehydrogenase small subunit
MRRSVRFILGDELREVAACEPTTSLLDWLRIEARLTGTKEGCNEGDCGACTVVIGRLTPEGLRYEALNSCIRFLPAVDGCHVLTIEHLRGQEGALHPLQQAMVAHHASQCGFCTPGIAMSLFALWLNEDAPDVARIEDALAGNLCRCTGYAPIIRAAQALYAGNLRAADPLLAGREAMSLRLARIQERGLLEIEGPHSTWLTPTTPGALAALYAQYPQARLVAGATDMALSVTKALARPEIVISLGRIPELQRIEDSGNALLIGATASLAAVRRALAAIHPALDELMRRFGGEQIRNAGTIGGNIANGSPIGDLPPALIALGATLILRRGEERREMPLENYFLAYGRQDRREGEFVEAVRVPRLAEGALLHVSKLSKRFDEDISTLCAAFRLDRDAAGRVTDARLAFGGMAATPKRAGRAEGALIGCRFDAAAAAEAAAALAQDFTPITDMRASAGYRLRVAQNLLTRFLIETEAPAVASRVAGRVEARADA